jgi:hypothetical protein
MVACSGSIARSPEFFAEVISFNHGERRVLIVGRNEVLADRHIGGEAVDRDQVKYASGRALLNCDGIIPVYLMASKILLDIGLGEIAAPSEG